MELIEVIDNELQRLDALQRDMKLWNYEQYTLMIAPLHQALATLAEKNQVALLKAEIPVEDEPDASYQMRLPEVKLEIESAEITAKTRKLAGPWTYEKETLADFVPKPEPKALTMQDILDQARAGKKNQATLEKQLVQIAKMRERRSVKEILDEARANVAAGKKKLYHDMDGTHEVDV